MDEPKKKLQRTSLATSAKSWALESLDSVSSKNWLTDGIVWQKCGICGNCYYPFRALCSNCLEDGLNWDLGDGEGVLLSSSRLHISFNDLYQRNGPWDIGIVSHGNDAKIFAFLDEDCSIGSKVALFATIDCMNELIFIAVSSDVTPRHAR